jgi:hypothetical protein
MNTQHFRDFNSNPLSAELIKRELNKSNMTWSNRWQGSIPKKKNWWGCIHAQTMTKQPQPKPDPRESETAQQIALLAKLAAGHPKMFGRGQWEFGWNPRRGLAGPERWNLQFEKLIN